MYIFSAGNPSSRALSQHCTDPTVVRNNGNRCTNVGGFVASRFSATFKAKF